jgi:septal ring factor EnvC (AmiA/AmiB activator)
VRFLLAVLALGLLAPVALGSPDDSLELESLRRLIQERREQVAEYERRERGLFDAIRSVDEAVRALSADLGRARREAETARARLRDIEAGSADLEVRLARTKRALASRAVALYKTGELGPVRMVFTAGSLRDRLQRVQTLRRLVRHDQKLLSRFHQEATALERARGEAVIAAAQRDEAALRFRTRSAELERERRRKRELLLEVRNDRARERAVLNELEAAARALEETLSHLRESPRRRRAEAAKVPFPSLQGRLQAPVPGPLLRGFGRVLDDEFRTQTFRKGVDFAVEIGDPVYSVAEGEVRFAGWFRGYGKLVILDHGEDYFSVSGHLEAIDVEVGDRVRGGDRIGVAGETGSLSGPRLYFEIRKGSGALDPADWLLPVPER